MEQAGYEPRSVWDDASRLDVRVSFWQQWVQQPQRLWLYNAFFQIHFWVGAIAGAYLTLISLTGSALVYGNDLAGWPTMKWLARLHSDLLGGQTGRFINGIGAVSLILLCLTGAVIWWPGVKNWRRSLRVEWGAHFPRINWDLHSAIGFWTFIFVLLWGISGNYLRLLPTGYLQKAA